ncbi:MAG: hypothetical protein GC159_04180 [Phycisphaera sp.]|nr:hypothetical protein [Phycisphaera sp.]
MNQINQIMERASAALNGTRYLECERLCLDALELARASGDFDSYARILLPLQECRRIRRQTAVDAGVHVLSGERLEAEAILDRHPEGCLLLTDPPYDDKDEAMVRALARQRELFVEVLVMDHAALRRSFESQLEQIGDAAIVAISDDLPPVQAVDALAAALERVGDHEIAHQRLAATARRAARGS